MTRRETATKLIVQRVILDELQAADREARTAARAGAFDKVGVRDVGEIGEESIGTVNVNKGRESWVVSDHRVLLAWVQENRPDMIVTTPSVNTAYVDALKADCKKDGGVADQRTGEITVPPGIELRQGDPILTVKPDPEARSVILSALGAEPLKMLGIGS